MEDTNAKTPPAAATAEDRSEAQLQTRAVWYYYVGGLTQQEIADRLGLTRLRVNKIVGQARAEGLVRIEIKMPLASCVALEEKLKARFALDDVSVVPSVPDPDTQQQVIGEAAGLMLEPLLQDGIGLGVGWGRTLREAARRMRAQRRPASWVTSLMGGLTRGSGTNTFEVATEFARLIGAECYYVAAPIYCPSVESRSTLLTHYGLADVMRRAREANVAILSCGDLSSRSLLASTHIVAESLPDLRAAGAIGDILGTFLDEYGRPVDHPLNQRVMALSPQELKIYPVSILASGGMGKLVIIRAILNARYIRRLVTDEAVAEALLQ
ncbi:MULTISPECIES: sugar-binding transcriptional regulator [Rhodomicrobium]|uniref:sugar-binding transcriptional regulator n=1 Tax=Rhodomicrobium TaxID=1068 RepID=UPI000B4B2B11|nr:MULTISPECIES: sugar-binding transcriptional regulator [Rhodomicrobium]